MTRYWLGVVHREHVLRGVELGIAQTNHGARTGIQRMEPGDGLVYYSPKTAYPDGDRLREFTAIGIVADAEPWQEDSEHRLWRRRVDFDRTAIAAPIAPMLELLDFTRDNPNWGFPLRRGQLELSRHDFVAIAHEMSSTLVP